jgi:transcriptional regulator with XRE-family HTH domain
MEAEVAERFGRNLSRARRHAVLSQEDLAGLAGVHRNEIGLLEQGRRVPKIDTLIKLAGGLGNQSRRIAGWDRVAAGNSSHRPVQA